MSKFKVGDKIVANKKASDRYHITKKGWEGVVTSLNCHEHDFKARSTKTDDEFGLYDRYFDLLVPDKKIVITTDGKTTLARMFEGNKVVKSAEAKCSPDDTFDFTVGAALAFDRLTEGRLSARTAPGIRGGKIPPSVLDGLVYEKRAERVQKPIKLYCVEDKRPYLRKGRVYECLDGVVKTDAGTKYDKRWFGHSLVPLVKRPAKVGELVYIHDAHKDWHEGYDNGDVIEAWSVSRSGDGIITCPHHIILHEYLVIDLTEAQKKTFKG